jgi:tetratricopeptide (TPR) repeat protein
MGDVPDGRADDLFEHAMVCPQCAEMLRSIIGIDEPVLNESRLMAEMEILHPRGQTVLAGKMAEQSRSRRGSGSRWLAAAAAVLVAAGLGWFLLQQRAEPPLALLARAYTERRQFEVRVPGASYGPLRIDKGGGAPIGELPAVLLEAQLATRKRLDLAPEDAEALHARGRAELLTWKFEEALQSFQAAADLGANSAEFLTDYATGFFLRAERNGTPVDYSAALERLGEALRKDPNNVAALFNRAIVHERLMQYDPAVADLLKVLALEQDGAWRTEAEARLAEVRKRIGAVFGTPKADASSGGELALERAMMGELANGRAELTGWASKLATAHRDPWLQEAVELQKSHGAEIRALTELAIARSSSSDPAGAALRLRELGGRRLPAALAMWLQYEYVHRAARSRSVDRCKIPGLVLENAKRYPWFAAQLTLEDSLCAAGRQDLAAAERQIGETERICDRYNLRLTRLHCMGVRAQRLVDTGYYRESLQLAHAALRLMEGAGYPSRRAYDFHTAILRAAAHLDRPHTARGAAAMMTSVSTRTGMKMFEMIGRSQAAAFAVRAGDADDARNEFQRASELADGLIANADASNYWRQARIGLFEFKHDLAALRQLLAESSELNTYFDRTLVGAICREELRAGKYERVDELAQGYLKRLIPADGAPRANLRAYRDDLREISRSAVQARLALGRPGDALATKLSMDDIDRRLMWPGVGKLAGTAAIPPRAAVVTAEKLGERLGIWTHTASGLRFRWVASHSALSLLARRLNRMTATETMPAGGIAAAARALSAVLFADVDRGTERVYFRANHELGTLPVSLLRELPSGGRPFISYLPYADLSRFEGEPGKIQVIAANRLNWEMTTLLPMRPSIDREIKLIFEAFPQVKVLDGDRATSTALDAAAQEPGILHFSGHAIRWRDKVALVVAPDAKDRRPDRANGLWTIDPASRFRSRLVVFSACGTALLSPQDTVTPDHLAETILLAGAGGVLATLWDVDAEASADWMGHFYRAMQRGRGPQPALEEANDALQKSAKWRHPRYWASYSLYLRSIPTV